MIYTSTIFAISRLSQTYLSLITSARFLIINGLKKQLIIDNLNGINYPQSLLKGEKSISNRIFRLIETFPELDLSGAVSVVELSGVE